MRKTWLGYDLIADIYEFDMGQNMPFDDIGYYVRQAALRDGRALELGCGTGRVTFPLLVGGRSVTAVDASEPMLRRLRHECSNLPLDQAQRLHLVRMDLRDWALRGEFSTILCPYSLFTYFVESDEYGPVLNHIHESLRGDGQFICDVFIPRRILPLGRVTTDYERCLPDGSVLTRSKLIEVDDIAGTHSITRRYERRWGADRRECFTTSERIRPWSADALESMLRRHHFEIVDRDFDYGFSTNESSAQFVTFRCRRSDREVTRP